MSTKIKFDINIKRTNRKKTIALSIKKDSIDLLVPKTFTNQQINHFLEKKAAWIRKKLETQNQLPNYIAKQFITGESFLYLGQYYQLNIEYEPHNNIHLTENTLEIKIKLSVQNQPHLIQALLKDWYKQKAGMLLKQRTISFAKKMQLSPKKISIKTYTACWGCCNSKNEIFYNWKIIMAPLRVIDYIIVHELCHLIEFNHSPKYWQQVRFYLPDYQYSKNWLKENASLLEW